MAALLFTLHFPHQNELFSGLLFHWLFPYQFPVSLPQPNLPEAARDLLLLQPSNPFTPVAGSPEALGGAHTPRSTPGATLVSAGWFPTPPHTSPTDCCHLSLINAYSAVLVSPPPGNPLFIIYSIAREKSWHVLRSRHHSDHVTCIVFLLTCAVRTIILSSCRRKFPCSTAREEQGPDSGWLCDSEAPGSRRPGPPPRPPYQTLRFVPVQSCPPAAGLPRHPCRARHSLHSSPVHPFVCIGEVLWLTFDSLSEYSSPCTPKLSSYCPGTEWVIHKCGQS